MHLIFDQNADAEDIIPAYPLHGSLTAEEIVPVLQYYSILPSTSMIPVHKTYKYPCTRRVAELQLSSISGSTFYR